MGQKQKKREGRTEKVFISGREEVRKVEMVNGGDKGK